MKMKDSISTPKRKILTVTISILLVAAITLSIVLPLVLLRKEKGGEGKTTHNYTDITESDDVYFIENGVTEYKAVIPADANSTVKFAAQELQTNFLEASGAFLEIITDENADLTEDGKYISIGDTTLFKSSGISLDVNVFGPHGLRLLTKQNTVYCYGLSDKGCLYAVYELLYHMFGYKYYAKGEVVLNKVESKKLFICDVVNIPDLKYRAFGYNEIDSDFNNTQRLRVQSLYDGWGIMYAHTYYKIVPPATYSIDHKDWYSPNNVNPDTGVGRDLCLSNVDVDVFTNNLKTIIENQPTSPYIMLGQEDTFTFCACDDCNERVAHWKAKGAYDDNAARAAIMMEFSNLVADKIADWIKVAHPHRTGLKLVTFAYNATKTAPVKYVDNTYLPLDPSVMPGDNLAVMIVPYNAVYNYNFFDEKNVGIKAQFESWNALNATLYVWMYDVNFENYMLPFDSWGSYSDNFKILKEYNVEFVFNQGSYNVPALNFGQMRHWVQAQLMWNTSLSTEALIDEFMLAYYKDAASPLKEYFNLIRNKFAIFAAGGEYVYSFGTAAFMNTNYWSYDFLNTQCKSFFDKAYAEIEYMKTSNPLMYSVLSERILRETLFYRGMLLRLYKQYYDDLAAVQLQYDLDCAKFGIYGFTEGV